ncbi:3-hydroxyacyl-CoA dehydrogenase family protein [Saxibacter everestensis]|uniref:3-hydroxyacyl-CoA dehydrogenase family protein n=1 Tax=Saxibacter everestensis TaxID=2909229 RepID=A0ABY8QPW0_9MICO|nr:3-hydroxyacyl-CoA dehydrogenase family protein [Brevibacteriaceae bacterium ZFBP1038]
MADSRRVVVIGAGLMGSGIAQEAALAGWTVTVQDVNSAALARARDTVADSLGKFAAKDRITADDVDAAMSRLDTSESLDVVAQADIVVEAVFESIEVKSQVFGELDRLAPAHAVLASNTTAIPITTIAAHTQRPESVLGLHFFSPVPMMKLVELIRGLNTSDETVARGRAFAEDLGKSVVVVNRDVAGFVTSRLIIALVNEAVGLVESGVMSAEDLDTACRLGFGHAMGPLATADLTGVDVLLHASDNIYQDTRDPKFVAPELMRRMVTAGKLGRKSGEGFYEYK